MPDPDPFSVPGFRALLRASGLAFVVALALALLDAGAGVRLPQPFRAAIPWVLIVSATVGVTLLVGALGTPKRGSPPPDDSGEG